MKSPARSAMPEAPLFNVLRANLWLLISCTNFCIKMSVIVNWRLLISRRFPNGASPIGQWAFFLTPMKLASFSWSTPKWQSLSPFQWALQTAMSFLMKLWNTWRCRSKNIRSGVWFVEINSHPDSKTSKGQVDPKNYFKKINLAQPAYSSAYMQFIVIRLE